MGPAPKLALGAAALFFLLLQSRKSAAAVVPSPRVPQVVNRRAVTLVSTPLYKGPSTLSGFVELGYVQMTDDGERLSRNGMPKSTVVDVSMVSSDKQWAEVTIPASTADALYDRNEPVTAWVPLTTLEFPT